MPLRHRPLRPLASDRGCAVRLAERASSRGRAWYRSTGDPVTIVIPTYGDPAATIEAVRGVARPPTAARARRGRRRRQRARAPGASARRSRTRELSSPARTTRLRRQRQPRHLRAAAGDDVVVLNNDVIAHRGWLERLQYAPTASRRIGIVGPKLLYPTGASSRPAPTATSARPSGSTTATASRPPTTGRRTCPTPCSAMTGACMYLKRER